MSGIKLFQPNGVGLLNEAGAQHPAPVEIDVGEICQLSFTGSTRIYRWTLSKPSSSASILTSTGSAGPSFMPDVDGGSYSISLIDENEVEYILDIVTPTTGGGGGGGGGGSSVAVAFEDYAAVRALSFSGGSPPSTFTVLRRATVGDGGEGLFVFLDGDTTSADNDGTVLIDGDGHRFKRVFSGAVDARWFGVIAYPTLAAAESGTDSHAAIVAAIEAISSITTASAHRVDLPYGFIRCASSLEISRCIHLRGHGKQSTVLVFPGTGHGMRIEHSQTSSDGGDASRSVIEGLAVWAVSTASAVDGIQIHANAVSLIGVDSLYFGRWGFHIFGSAVGTQGNANDWRMDMCSAWFCGQAGSGDDRGGLYVHGNDSSAGNNQKFQALEITGIGIREESFLGNTHDTCHVEVASGVSYQTRSAQVSRSTFMNCYAEGAQPIKLYYPNVWVGGYPGTSFSSDSDGLILLDSGGSYPFGISNRETGTKHATFYTGDYANALGSGATRAVFGWAADGVAVNTEDYSVFWDDSLYQWSMQRHAGHSSPESLVHWITGWGHSRPHSHFGIHVLLLDDVRVTTGTSAPSTGIWRKGDKQINSAPAIGGTKEWICTTAGGWASAWVANTVYNNHATVSPTTPNGYVYEMVSYNTGTSHATTEPTWPTTPGNTVSDNGMTWKNVGVTPAVFEAVTGGSIAATSTTRVVREYPLFDATEYSLDRDFQPTTLVATAAVIVWPLELPHGCTLDSITIKVNGANGHGALPGTMPVLKWRKWDISAASGSVSAGTTDGSASVGAFEGNHTITKSSIAEVIDNSTTRYGVQFESEDGANAMAGLVVLGITVTFTTATTADLGAS